MCNGNWPLADWHRRPWPVEVGDDSDLKSSKDVEVGMDPITYLIQS